MSARLEAVLRDHLFTLYPGEIDCDCEWTAKDADDSRAGDERLIAEHIAHVAAEVRAWLSEQLADEGLREAVARATCGETWDGDRPVPVLADLYRRHATAALAAVRDHLTTEPQPTTTKEAS